MSPPTSIRLAAPALAIAAADLIFGALTTWISDLSDTQSPGETAAEFAASGRRGPGVRHFA